MFLDPVSTLKILFVLKHTLQFDERSKNHHSPTLKAHFKFWMKGLQRFRNKLGKWQQSRSVE